MIEITILENLRKHGIFIYRSCKYNVEKFNILMLQRAFINAVVLREGYRAT